MPAPAFAAAMPSATMSRMLVGMPGWRLLPQGPLIAA
jgi:hypothetical protein